MVEGLEDGGFALISKTHHALIDGIAGVDLAQVHLRPRPGAGRGRRTPTRPWQPAREPTGGAAAGLGHARPAAHRPAHGARPRRRSATRPADGAALGARGRRGPRRGRLGRPEPGAADAAERRDRPAPALPSSCATSSPTSRRSRTPSAARSTTSCSTVVSGALRDVAALARRAHRGPRAARARAGLDPHRRPARDHAATGSPRCAARCRSTSRTRSRACARSRPAMDGLKESKQAVGAEVLASVQNFAPPTILAQASRLNFSTRLFNLIVTNVPGPAVPALRARARDARRLPGRLPAQGPRAGHRDHVLQRRA